MFSSRHRTCSVPFRSSLRRLMRPPFLWTACVSMAVTSQASPDDRPSTVNNHGRDSLLQSLQQPRHQCSAQSDENENCFNVRSTIHLLQNYCCSQHIWPSAWSHSVCASSVCDWQDEEFVCARIGVCQFSDAACCGNSFFVKCIRALTEWHQPKQCDDGPFVVS